MKQQELQWKWDNKFQPLTKLSDIALTMILETLKRYPHNWFNHSSEEWYKAITKEKARRKSIINLN